jgi:hypothetical protein
VLVHVRDRRFAVGHPTKLAGVRHRLNQSALEKGMDEQHDAAGNVPAAS